MKFMGPAMSKLLSSNDIIKSSHDSSNLLLLKNTYRSAVGASLDTGFAQHPKN